MIISVLYFHEFKPFIFQEFEKTKSELELKTQELNQVLETKSGEIENLNDKVGILEGQLKETSEDNSEHEEQKTRIIELISQVEQNREQKVSDDLNLASIKETVDNLQSQLNEKESEILQLEQVKDESQAAKLQLQDQLDSLTIVAENLQTLQHQVHLKDNEIEQLRNELEQVRQDLDQVRNNQVRPPPDITQQPSVQPDIGNAQLSFTVFENQPKCRISFKFCQNSANVIYIFILAKKFTTNFTFTFYFLIASSVQSVQPDLMPPISASSQQVSPFDLVQNNDGWDNDWADDNAANWFDNDNNQAAQVVDSGADDQLLQQKEEECQALKQQIDTLISARAELEGKVTEMRETNEKLMEKVSTLEVHISQQTVHCQTEEEVLEVPEATIGNEFCPKNLQD